MKKIEFMRQYALSFPLTNEEPHFEKISFRVNKKIFATFDPSDGKVILKLSLMHQKQFCAVNYFRIYPVPGRWGEKGWTVFDLEKLDKELLKDGLLYAYVQVAPKKLVDLVQQHSKKPIL